MGRKKSGIDWEDAELEYLNSRISLKDLAEKRQISLIVASSYCAILQHLFGRGDDKVGGNSPSVLHLPAHLYLDSARRECKGLLLREG